MIVDVVLVTGGRTYSNTAAVWHALDVLRPRLIIHGAARGADRRADAWARNRRVHYCRVAADWDRYGRGAGHRRNEDMCNALAAFAPPVRTAVVWFPGGAGTEGCRRYARSIGLTEIAGEWIR